VLEYLEAICMESKINEENTKPNSKEYVHSLDEDSDNESNQDEPPSLSSLRLDSNPTFEGLSISRKEWHHPAQFSFTKELEDNWLEIKREWEELEKSLCHPWPERELYQKEGKKGEGWDVFGLYAFGKKHYRNAKLCPKTTNLVETIPGMSTAAFSILNANSRIVPHVGYYGYSEMVLRCHLGLVIPKEKDLCYLKVGDGTMSWDEGKTLIFDDTYTHSAVNATEQPRVILLLDFSAGPIPEEMKHKPKKPNDDTEEETIEKEKESADQRGYLDLITTQYGYGIADDS